MPLKNTRSRGKNTVRGGIFILSAPSGAGKTTLCRMACSTIPGLKHSVSITTRKRRRGEKNNVHYSFVTKERFQSMIRRGELAEWAVVHGNLYGTSKKRLLEIRKRGHDAILDIDVKGALQLKQTCRDAVFIFVLPPSMRVLEQRLKHRGSDDPDEIRKRLRNAREELSHYGEYDFIVVNDDLEKALRDLESIIISRRLRTAAVDSKLIKNLK